MRAMYGLELSPKIAQNLRKANENRARGRSSLSRALRRTLRNKRGVTGSHMRTYGLVPIDVIDELGHERKNDPI